MNQLRTFLLLALCSAPLWVSAQNFEVKSIRGGRYEITSALDASIPQGARDFLAPYKQKVDSMMCPVLGESASYMRSFRPESPLSNLIADILRVEAVNVTGKPVDLAVCNIGGIRSALPQGPVTVGDILEIAPFENMYCVVTLSGEHLLELFSQIAAVKGEGVSGIKLKISSEGKLLQATVAGKPVESKRDYRIATLDYLSEGNDKLYAFKKASCVETTTLPVREVLMSYIKEQARKGLKVDAKIEGRITVEGYENKN